MHSWGVHTHALRLRLRPEGAPAAWGVGSLGPCRQELGTLPGGLAPGPPPDHGLQPSWGWPKEDPPRLGVAERDGACGPPQPSIHACISSGAPTQWGGLGPHTAGKTGTPTQRGGLGPLAAGKDWDPHAAGKDWDPLQRGRTGTPTQRGRTGTPTQRGGLGPPRSGEDWDPHAAGRTGTPCRVHPGWQVVAPHVSPAGFRPAALPVGPSGARPGASPLKDRNDSAHPP